ncbi:glycosyltransferase family 39 protein [Hydrogenibacillus sp. N12]|uniref:glycosyltransferase family 39 protein n=1 Tax=Hydrogenibacillus sp. N12 TaxID=2866627 RepID=UPI001C7DF9F9|nr:glycosyltransferase family 39 protein [Hydrogenibacillus sp. N12]QZA32872.1 glycosyltransferase family 39 protein [Hydrogenibacillus sp. N12]
MTEILLAAPFFLAALLFVVVIGFVRPKVFFVLLMALILRTALALIHAFVVPLPDSQADAVMYHHTAEMWSSEGLGGALKHFTTGAFLYSWVLAVIYSLTGPVELAGQSLNVLLGVASVYLVWRIAMCLTNGDVRTAKRAAWIAAFFPTLNLYSAITMREAFIVFFFLLGTLYIINWSQNWSPVQFVKGTAAYLASGFFHTGMFMSIITLGFLLSSMQAYKLLKQRGRLSLKLLGAAVFLVFAAAVVLMTGWGMDKIGIAKNISYFHEYTSSERAGYLQSMTVESPLDLIWQAPIRLFYFLFAPFPWMVRSAIDLFGLVDALLYFLMTSMIIGRWKNIDSRALKFSLAVVAVGLLAFALATSNYGQAIRHRAKFAPLLIPMALAVSRKAKARARDRVKGKAMWNERQEVGSGATS